MNSENHYKQLKEKKEKAFQEKANRPGNKAWIVSKKRKLLTILILTASACLYATTFPPFNLSFFAWISIIPLFLLLDNFSMKKSFFIGYYWGWIWSFFSFLWFREIEFCLPLPIAFMMAFYPALWAMLIPVFRQAIIPDKISLNTNIKTGKLKIFEHFKIILFIFTCAAWWCVLEWIRSWLFSGFPWNFAGTTQWQNLSIIQICEITGVYGVSFIIIFFNLALASSFKNLKQTITKGRYQRPIPLVFAILLIGLALLFGITTISKYNLNNMIKKQTPNNVVLRTALIQADIPQCRFPKGGEAAFALNQYLNLSEMAAITKPDLLLWGETAVPVPYFSNYSFGKYYRYKINSFQKKYKIPMMLGTIDFGEIIDKSQDPNYPPTYNAVFYLNSKSEVIDKYYKQHLVPFGEYTPYGEYYPWLKEKLGMGRSLTPGKRFSIFEIKKGVRAGVPICFEDVFPYISREFALKGANLLIVFSNDAWYPNSSESEQHMVNSIFRTIETRLTMIRVGNNNCSCLILPNGFIADSVSITKNKNKKYILSPKISSRGFAIFKVLIPQNNSLTFYTKYGDVFILLCGISVFITTLFALWQWRARKEKLLKTF